MKNNLNSLNSCVMMFFYKSYSVDHQGYEENGVSMIAIPYENILYLQNFEFASEAFEDIEPTKQELQQKESCDEYFGPGLYYNKNRCNIHLINGQTIKNVTLLTKQDNKLPLTAKQGEETDIAHILGHLSII